MKILDCTLRDGGYYTNWDFESTLFQEYLVTMNELPIEYIEIGYRQPLKGKYMGECAYLPIQTICKIQKYAPNKKLAIMLNVKDINEETISQLLLPLVGAVSLIRFAVAPNDIERAISFFRETKKLGFSVSANIMYMSTWQTNELFWTKLSLLDGCVDIVCMVDSFGSIYPNEIPQIVNKLRHSISVPIGFHGHDNMTLAFANTLAALQSGCEYVDSTIMGMGRGAGNLRTELLMAYCNKSDGSINLNGLVDLVARFTHLRDIYQWGTNIPYMISGANSLPQKDIMSLLSQKRYSVARIVRQLQNNLNPNITNKYPLIQENKRHEDVILIGGGDSVFVHTDAILNYLSKNQSKPVCFLSAKSLSLFTGIQNPRYICLIGNEGARVEKNKDYLLPNDVFVLSDTRSTETYVPDCIINNTFIVSMQNNECGADYIDAPLALAMELVPCISHSRLVLLIGMDGYVETGRANMYDMMLENQSIIDEYSQQYFYRSLLPTKYNNVEHSSIYGELI